MRLEEGMWVLIHVFLLRRNFIDGEVKIYTNHSRANEKILMEF